MTKTDMQWVKSALGTPALTREVEALRCGLDATAWDGAGALRCADALGLAREKIPKDNDPLPFDHARSHALYKALFGEVENLIKGKHLLIVPSGPLTQLPFQVLITAASAAWANKCDHGLIIHRDKPGNLTTHVKIAKSKDFSRMGVPGTVDMEFIPDQSYFR